MKNKKKGFTLIELLIVIAIIGILASVILVSLSSGRDKAKQKSAYAEARSVQAAINLCLFSEGKRLYCYGTSGNLTSSYDCGGGSAAYPVAGTSICGTAEGNPGSGHSASAWTDVSKHGYSYGAYAGSKITEGKFAFTIYKNGSNTVFCCTHVGCEEMIDAGATKGSPCRASENIVPED